MLCSPAWITGSLTHFAHYLIERMKFMKMCSAFKRVKREWPRLVSSQETCPLSMLMESNKCNCQPKFCSFFAIYVASSNSGYPLSGSAKKKRNLRRFGRLLEYYYSRKWYIALSLLIMSSCQHVIMSVGQHVSMSSHHHVSMSACQHVSLSACQHVSMSACQQVSMSSCHLDGDREKLITETVKNERTNVKVISLHFFTTMI